MEGVFARVYKGLRGYRKRRGYERLGSRGKSQVEFGGSTRRRRFYSRIKKLKLKLRFSPKKFFVRIPDGYVNMTVRLAKSQVEFGGSTRRRRFYSRINKWQLKLRFSPKKFFVRIRDGYVNMMMRLASSRFMVGGGGDGSGGFGSRPLKEYDEKMIVEVYKSLVMMVQDQLVHRDAGELGSRALCRR